MQNAVVWWCTLIGVTDPSAIQVATGIIAGGSLILIVVWIFNMIFGAIKLLSDYT